MKSLGNLIAVLLVVMIASHTAFAGQPKNAPEIAPAMGTAVFALLSGAIMVIRGRIKR
jgi:hypothetical protein